MGTSSSSTTTNSPPDWAKPGFELAGKTATDYFKNGVGNGVYEGSTVAPLSDTTMQGLNATVNAGANYDTSGSRPLFQGIGAGAGQVYNEASAPSSAQSNLTNFANGNYLDPASNPYYSSALKNALTSAGNQVQSQFSGAGRLGSAADTNALGNTLGNIAVNAANNQYNQNVATMLGANSQIDAANSANRATQLGALGAGQTAANSIAGLDQQGFQNALTGANAITGAGQALDTQAQKEKNDEVNLFYSNLMQPWNYLGVFENALSGSAGNYGTQRTSASSSNPLAAIGTAGSLIGGLK